MNPLTGGPCQGIRNLDKASRKLGIHREVVSLDQPTASFLGQDTFPIYALGSDMPSWAYSAKLIPWLIDNLERFDVVIVNGLWLYPSYAVWKALRVVKRRSGAQTPKFFIMPHGMLDPWFQNAKGRKLKAIRNWLYWKFIENRVVNDSDGLLFTCETELQLARKPFRPYHPKQEINVGYGVGEPPKYTNAMRVAFLEKCATVQDQPYLLFLSRIHYKKGVDLLIKAYASLLNSKVQSDFAIPNLVIVGPGLETSYGTSILKFVSETSQLKDRVFFPGMLSGDAKWGVIYGCEAFVLPSHQENFGIAVVEALACGKPVLISNQVNIWQEIETGGGGLVAPDTYEGTRQLLANWFNLPISQRESVGVKARQTFENNFQVEQAATRILRALTVDTTPIT
ncbi:glycosyltransferase [Spirosoma validum]|nr:glycosyltransferase [Spirosoma validum]